MAPDSRGGERLNISEVGERVVEWFERGTLLPSEWDGTPLMTLVYEIYSILHGYVCISEFKKDY